MFQQTQWHWVKTYISQLLLKQRQLMALRLQKERMDDALLPSMREYRNTFGITHELLQECAKDKVLIMHPGPINRGVELSGTVADGPRSVILQQVTNGLAVRMAVLFLVTGGTKISEE